MDEEIAKCELKCGACQTRTHARAFIQNKTKGKIINMKIALFVTGSVRTLFLQCTLHRVLQYIALPLKAEVFYSINVPSIAHISAVSEYLDTTSNGIVAVIYKDVYVDKGNYVETQSCSALVARVIGRPQAEGMVRCMRKLESTGRNYDYIIRTRTDLYIPFGILSLPPPIANVAFVGFVGKKCNGKTAWWVDDRFAILPTTATQRVYFYGYAHDLCREDCFDHTCHAPECKLGSALSRRNMRVVDLREISSTVSLQIIRQNCSLETVDKHWIRPSWMPPFWLQAHNLSRLLNKKKRTLVQNER